MLGCKRNDVIHGELMLRQNPLRACTSSGDLWKGLCENSSRKATV